MIQRKRNRIEAKETMLLVCASQAEVDYFSQFRKDCRYSNLTVELADKRGNLTQLIDSAAKSRNKGKYSSCWILFGFEEVGTNVAEIDGIGEYAAKKRVNLLFFNPTFELYFLLFDQSPRTLLTKSEIVRKVADRYKGFDGSSRYFLTDGLGLNLKIYPRLIEADKNARRYNYEIEEQIGLAATTLPQFLDSLKTVCGKADMTQVK